MIAEFKAKVYHAKGTNGTSSYPVDQQVICWSDCPDEPNTWKVDEVVIEDGVLWTVKGNAVLPTQFYWFQIPQFVVQYKLAQDAGL